MKNRRENPETPRGTNRATGRGRRDRGPGEMDK